MTSCLNLFVASNGCTAVLDARSREERLAGIVRLTMVIQLRRVQIRHVIRDHHGRDDRDYPKTTVVASESRLPVVSRLVNPTRAAKYINTGEGNFLMCYLTD